MRKLFSLNKNISLYLLTNLLINIGFGIVGADFNLYILSMGMQPDFLGVILSLTPFAQVLAAIPIGFLAEKIGSKRALIFVNLVVGFSSLLRVISPNRTLILLGSFLIGTVQAGFFIIQMPFISQYSGENKDREFTTASIVFYTAMAVGNLIGGYLPGIVNPLFTNETLAFRSILVGAVSLIIFGTIPLLFLKKDAPEDTSNISLSPYLKGIDKNTMRFAGIEFFIGAGLGLLIFFMNVIFLFYYNSTLEVYGTMSALLIIPMVALLFAGPSLTKRFNSLRVIVFARVLTIAAALTIALTQNVWVGAPAYITYRALMGLGQSLWISFASSVATKRSRVATSTWLEMTFQLGFAFAALAGGKLIALNAYPALGFISAGMMAAALVLTFAFFGKEHLQRSIAE